MINKVKWGVIGSGGIARRRTIPEGIMKAENAELVAVYDINSEVNKSVAKEFNAKAVDSIGELVNSGIDAVYVASPANMHLDTCNCLCRGEETCSVRKASGYDDRRG